MKVTYEVFGRPLLIDALSVYITNIAVITKGTEVLKCSP